MKSFVGFILGLVLTTVTMFGQDMVPPAPQQFVIHSKVLNEDRVIWVRTPPGYKDGTGRFPVLYHTDAPGHVNELGALNDYLVENGRMPKLIIVGIANTDRVRDLTPTHADAKQPDGSPSPYPTSGGGDHFLDFIQTELIPEIETRYRTQPFRIFGGHSLGGLLVVHTLITRPELFGGYLAVSPSLQFDNGRTFHQAEEYFSKQDTLNKTLFFSLANEGNPPNPMGENFAALGQFLKTKAPKGLLWDTKRYPDEDHGSTVLRSHYDGLRYIFDGWAVPRDQKTGAYLGGLAGVEKHFSDLSQRFGYSLSIPEQTINQLGYQLIAEKKLDEAVAALKRNVELHPASANVYDSLGEALEASGKYDDAAHNFQKAVEIGTKINDQDLNQFKAHLDRVAKEKASPAH